ncbi:hypothetical protein ABT336_19910 [Micromonospora sp. NPDC000207]|uniref:hypothetical protein n=1 Tax=Micromonospora sp. NPDC000207 TaxID=3154246 RepID=UPI0033170C21
MLRTIGAALAATLALTGIVAGPGPTALGSPAPGSIVLGSVAAPPTPPVACPPALPITGMVTATTATSVTVRYSMLLTPPCGYDPPIRVTLYTSRQDAQQRNAPVTSAVSGPQRYGDVTVDGLTPATEYWYRFSDAHGTWDPYIIGGPARTTP